MCPLATGLGATFDETVCEITLDDELRLIGLVLRTF